MLHLVYAEMGLYAQFMSLVKQFYPFLVGIIFKKTSSNEELMFCWKLLMLSF